ncbi:hypothetical protein TRVA0_019S01464 [Trichomonascus vanleenenianus]|uniref:uncharacterized protein n=1 Tax=Trichomonascus vanleenenianus TaxID=2268995 RepID=UPI003ECB763F
MKKDKNAIISNKFNELPVEILREIVQHVDVKEMKSWRLVNWTFCSAIDDRTWQKLDITLNKKLIVQNSVSIVRLQYKSKIFANLLECLDRNAARLKTVIVRSVVSSYIDEMAKLFSIILSKGINVGKVNLRLSALDSHAIDQLEKVVSPHPSSPPFCSIELRPPLTESVVNMIDVLCPYENDRLEISVNSNMLITSIPFSLILSYGGVITSLKLDITDEKNVARLISYLEFCTNLEILHVNIGGDMMGTTDLPEGTTVTVPESVKRFTFTPSPNVPAMTIMIPGIEHFAIDCATYPSAVQLKFASLATLVLTTCTKVTNEQLSTFAQMCVWGTMELDTMEFAEILRFKPLIKRTTEVLDIYGSSSEPFEFGFDYLDNYVDWLDTMQESISHLNAVVLKFPMLPPEKLKIFMVKNIFSKLPKLQVLYFRQDSIQSDGMAILTKQYPFLTPVNDKVRVCDLFYIDRADIDEIQHQLSLCLEEQE